MSYPANVQTLRQVKSKGGRPRRINPSCADDDDPDHAQAEGEEEERQKRHQEGRGEDGGVGGVEVGWGQEGAARVEKRGKGWAWGFVSENQEDLKLGLGEGGMVFPPSREIPLLRDVSDRPTNAQSLEYARQICDKYEHLGLDELISAELDSETHLGDPGRTYDPFLGRRMAYVRNGHAKLGRNMVFFAAGELGNHLHVATQLGDSNKVIKNSPLTRFLAGSVAVERYPTPILQISASPVISPYRGEDREHATTLIIRFHSSLTIYRLSPDPTYSPTHLLAGSSSVSPVKLIKMGEIRPRDTGGRRIVDITPDPTEWGRMAMVDESGGVWVWRWRRVTAKERGESGMVLSNIRAGDPGGRNGFYRVAYGTRPGTLLVLSCSEAVVIDIEDPTYPATTLLTLGPDRQFAALDATAASRQAVYTCLVTSREVLWVDESRSNGVPVLSWKHEISDGGVRDLEITHVPREDSDCFMLSSRTNPTMLVFHLSTDTPLHLLHPPYTLSTRLDPRLRPLTDPTIFDRNAEMPNSGEEALELLALAQDGSVWSAPVQPLSTDDEPGSENGLKAVWDAELQKRAKDGVLGTQVGKAGEDKSETRYTIMDTRWAWLELAPEDDDPNFTADEFERYIREIDAPFDHFVTAAELARDSVLAEGEPKRSHILRSLPTPSLDPAEIARLSSLDFRRDLHVVSSNSIPASSIDGHLDNSTFISSLADIRQALETAFPLRVETPATRSRHAKCVDALAIDLALSTAVLSSEVIPRLVPEVTAPRGNTDDDVLALAAGLTLSDTGPPAVESGILRPRFPASALGGDDDGDEEEEEDEGAKVKLGTIQNLTVRSLLADWGPSTSPTSYKWKPWLDIPTPDHSPNPNIHNLSITVPTPSHPSTQPSQRPIRPLPSSPRPGSPRHPPSSSNPNPGGFFSQPILSNRYAPPVVQSQPNPASGPAPWESQHPLRKKGSVPFIIPSGFGSGGSSPVGDGPSSAGVDGGRGRGRERGQGGGGEGGEGEASQEGFWGAATQVERGPFGGRHGGQGPEKKKKAKKRVGGF